MRAVRVLSAILLLALSFGSRADPPDSYPFVSYDEGLRTARQNGKPIFLYFGRLGCGWCDLTNKQAFSDENIKRTYTGHYVLVYVDAEGGQRLTLPSGERITEMELGTRFKAFATPLFAYLEPDGKLIFKIAGVQTVKDFVAYDRFVREGIYRTKDIRKFLAEMP